MNTNKKNLRSFWGRLTRRKKRILTLILVNLVLLGAALIWENQTSNNQVEIAVAKGQQMIEMNMGDSYSIDPETYKQIVSSDEKFNTLTQGHSLEFVNAIPLTSGESRRWQDAGCDVDNCTHVTFYDLEVGGTAELIINTQQAAIVSRWLNTNGRPGGSPYILPKAMAIAAEDDEVKATLGNIGAADPAMVPMSAWLLDDPCREEWCVDLTFHDPSGSGKIFHVFVNMERNEVARTFYSRGRPDRSLGKPITQRNSYTDGCQEQYNWEVCWEMTASDGVNFKDASYNGRLIFSSAKIGQVEAWYPSWPGGYRDEIGFAGSVPPFGDTIIEDFGDGFAVSQLFTEFTHWPNCICCYRYEEVIRFFEDGRLEFDFVSHGPGCDDPSVYRPFWRIDLDLDGPENDRVWLWETNMWNEADEEFEIFPVVQDLSPSGYKLATIDEDLGFHWQMIPTDPLEVDEGYLFLLQNKQGEGDGPIVTGPGDTFIPPRQWIDGDSLSGENIVLWFVPLLYQKKGGPYWCTPDPDPAFSPCNAVLLAEPAIELDQVQVAPTATTPPPIESGPVFTPIPSPTFQPTSTPTAQPTTPPRLIDGSEAEEIILNAGCGSCHQIGQLGEAHKVGPDLSDIGSLAQDRVPGQAGEDYIRESIIDPNSIIVPDCPNGPCLPNIMPRDYSSRLSAEQIDTLVEYLLEQRGAPTQSIDQVTTSSSTAAPKAFPAPKNARRNQATEILSPTFVVQILLLSLVFLISLLVFLKGSADNPD